MSLFTCNPLAAISLSIPFDACPDTNCRRKLVYKPPITGVLYTISRGVVPILCPSLYCNGERFLYHTFQQHKLLRIRSNFVHAAGCRTRFYHNYYVKNASGPGPIRTYYSPASPAQIEISDHIFVDVGFCEWIRSEFALNRCVFLRSKRNP